MRGWPAARVSPQPPRRSNLWFEPRAARAAISILDQDTARQTCACFDPASLDDIVSTVASLACQVDAYLGAPTAAAGTHLAAQMQRSALDALASLSRAWEGAGTARLREMERGLGALYELKLYTRIALQDPSGSDPHLSLIYALGRVSVDSLRSLLRLLPETVW